MYQEFYGLTEKPFNLTPDPRFLYLSSKHKEAFAHLMYGIRHRSGFVMVSGEIGTGKTTICRSLLKDLDPDIEIALIFNPYLSPQELLKRINQDFGIESESSSILELIDELNTYLLDRAREGKNCVLIIDEAQDLNADVLEQIRLLSNLETEKEKLLQIMLIGQPELAEKLEMHELRQLNQRITARYHLETLSEDETLHYIAFRLRVAGGRKKVRFSRKAVREVYKISSGTPRVINALCDRALLIGYTQELREITPKIIKAAAKEIQGVEHVKTTPLNISSILRTGGVLSSAAVIVLLMVLATSGQFPTLNSGTSTTGDERTDLASSTAVPNQVDATILPRESATDPSPEDPLETLENLMASSEQSAETKPASDAEPTDPPVVEKRDVTVVEPDTADVAETEEPELTSAIQDPPPQPAEQQSDPDPELVSVIQDPPPQPAEEGIVSEENEPERITVASVPEPALEPVATAPEETDAEPRASLRKALEALFATWEATPSGTLPSSNTADAAASYLRANGFTVASLAASVQQLVLLNRPALLLTNQAGAEQWIALTGYNSGVCTVTNPLGDEEHLTTNELAGIYRERALVPWRDSQPNADAITLLDSGERIWALQHNLAALGLLRTEPNGVYDTATEKTIRDMQRICGLDVDGIFGAQSRLALNGWLGEDNAPTLGPETYPASTQNALAARLPEPQTVDPIQTESEEPVPSEPEIAEEPTEPAPVEETSPAETGVDVEELPSSPRDVTQYEPILPPRRGPASDAVTEPAETIVPLKPSRNFNQDNDDA